MRNAQKIKHLFLHKAEDASVQVRNDWPTRMTSFSNDSVVNNRPIKIERNDKTFAATMTPLSDEGSRCVAIVNPTGLMTFL